MGLRFDRFFNVLRLRTGKTLTERGAVAVASVDRCVKRKLRSRYAPERAYLWPAGPFDCDVFLTTDPIATGTVHIVRTDNDWNLDGGRMNAYGWRANGTLHDANGAAYRFREVIMLQWPDGAGGNVVRNLRVSLVPIS